MVRDYSHRQTLYLRISPHRVLQMLLYLQHPTWFNDERMERVLLALKERLPEKMAKEEKVTGSTSKGFKLSPPKGTVDVYRAADYQMAFYFRRLQRTHAILLKNKELDFTGARPKRSASPDALRDPERGHGVPDESLGLDGGAPAAVKGEVGEDGLPLAGGGAFTGVADDDDDGPGAAIDVDSDEEGEKIKPTLLVDYTGFSIHRWILVVVVEPFPPFKPEEPTPAPEEVSQLSKIPKPRNATADSRSASVANGSRQ